MLEAVRAKYMSKLAIGMGIFPQCTHADCTRRGHMKESEETRPTHEAQFDCLLRSSYYP